MLSLSHVVPLVCPGCPLTMGIPAWDGKWVTHSVWADDKWRSRQNTWR